MSYAVSILEKYFKLNEINVFIKLLFCMFKYKFIRRRELVFSMADTMRSQGQFLGENMTMVQYRKWSNIAPEVLEKIRNDGEYVWPDLQSKINNGSVLWCLLIDDKLAFVALATEGKYVDKYYTILEPTDIVISHCLTFPEYYKKKLYPLFLSEFSRNCESSKLFISCLDWNIPSVKGIVNAGFTFLGYGYKDYKFTQKSKTRLPRLEEYISKYPIIANDISKGVDLSIIIVSWNTRQITCDCIKSVYDQVTMLNYEIIVVDNASSDDSIKSIRSQFPEVVIIANADNRGFAAANNHGMKIAKGRYILLLNSDTVVLDNTLDKVVAFAEESPAAGIVGCKVLNLDKTLQSTLFRYPGIGSLIISAFSIDKIFGIHMFGRYNKSVYSCTGKVEAIAGCFMLVRKEAIMQVGAMDEDYFMYAEEADWCYRFTQSGWDVVYTPIAQIVHRIGESSKQANQDMALQRKTGILQFMQKHRTWSLYYLACLLTSLWFCLRILPWLVKGLIVPRDRAYALSVAKNYTIGMIKALFGWRALAMKE